jgi:XTP/dITP diphosphohydrolase
MSASLNDGMMIDGVFADDTGLEIDALGGKPGVYTARWYLMNDGMIAGKPLNDEMMIFTANRAKALRELEGKSDRGAQFRTVITLIRVTGDRLQDATLQVEGVVQGRIAEEEYGNGGFGYDPVFIPEGYDKTFGELPAEVKNNISHRARALQSLVKLILKEKL